MARGNRRLAAIRCAVASHGDAGAASASACRRRTRHHPTASRAVSSRTPAAQNATNAVNAMSSVAASTVSGVAAASTIPAPAPAATRRQAGAGAASPSAARSDGLRLHRRLVASHASVIGGAASAASRPAHATRRSAAALTPLQHARAQRP